MPGQLGPISSALCSRTVNMARVMSMTGMPSVMQTINWMPALAASMMASAAPRGGHENAAGRRARGCDGLADRIENWHAFDGFAAFAGRDAADDAGAGGFHVARVKLSLTSGDALHNDRRV